ncbi:MAG: flagellar assembly peptidoglycan hydrolase FlgJ [Burkholderiales bacterium]|nr:flagellar assembly peptidoglycan hydrolase FlgJ [Burkholderiales bacterium]
MAVYSHDIAARLALDTQSIDALRAQAQRDPQRALKAAARQFEALFMNMMLKSMREATPQDGMFDNDQTRLYTSLLDQQLAQSLSAQGVGLADIMIRQLTRVAGPEALRTPPTAAISAPSRGAADTRSALPADNASEPLSGGSSVRPTAAIRDFMSRHWAHARAASEATGIPARFLLAQAALESGWGRQEIRGADGTASFNLFGIKAGRNWPGKVVEATTTEYVDGVPYKTTERFRAYGSYAESFRDYANLLLTNPRYAQVLDQQDSAGFARGLQRAGYATDPKYADKLMRILDGIESRFSAMG